MSLKLARLFAALSLSLIPFGIGTIGAHAAESCSNEGGIWMMVNQNPTSGTLGILQFETRTLANCGGFTPIAWSTNGIALGANFGNWAETGYEIEYGQYKQHIDDWFTEWGLNYTTKGRNESTFSSLCNFGTHSGNWQVVNSGSSSWTGLVDCGDGHGWRNLHTYSGTGFTTGQSWSETGRYGGTGTTMQDYHYNLQYRSTSGSWYYWPSMFCEVNSTSNWYPGILGGSAYQILQGSPSCP